MQAIVQSQSGAVRRRMEKIVDVANRLLHWAKRFMITDTGTRYNDRKNNQCTKITHFVQYSPNTHQQHTNIIQRGEFEAALA